MIQESYRQWGKYALLIVLLIGLDVSITLPIMDAARRPRSWTSTARADGAECTIRSMAVLGGSIVSLSIEAPVGTLCTMQRNTNGLNPTGWIDMTNAVMTTNWIHLRGTNPPTGIGYYRIHPPE